MKVDASIYFDELPDRVKGAWTMKKLPSCCAGGSDGATPAFPPDLADRAEVFKALGDAVRLAILHLVQDQEVCVCDLVPLVGVVQSTLSHHLSVLQKAGLVTARKEGRWNYYQATEAAKAPLRVFAAAEPAAVTV
jgi:ArsR family transcriptional regulator